MPVISDAEIQEHLRARREFCEVLLELSRRQRALIAERDYSELIAVIARKQRVLGRLDALKENQPTIVAEWTNRRDRLPADIRSTCETHLRQTESLLVELLEEEQSSTDELARSRDETHRQLVEISSGRRAHRAYGSQSAAPSHRYLDVNQ